jgi:hypothetical protein
MNKNNDGFLKTDIDPAVAAVLNGSRQRQVERNLPRDQRKKVKRSQAKQAARNGSRAVYDVDPDLIDFVKKLAAENGTTASQVAAIALHLLQRSIRSGEVDLAKYRQPLANNPRYEYELVWEE